MRVRSIVVDGDFAPAILAVATLAAGVRQTACRGITCAGPLAPTEELLQQGRALGAPVCSGTAAPFRSGPFRQPTGGGDRRETLRAVECWADAAQSPGGMSAVLLGPLTNAADFLIAYPHLIPRVERFVVLGGGALRGDRTPAAEHSIWSDPEAARIVFSSGVPITMCGLDIVRTAYLDAREAARLRALDTPGGRAVSRLAGCEEGRALARCAPAALYCLLEPQGGDRRSCFVEIDLWGEYTRGCTVANLTGYLPDKKPNVEVVLGLERESYLHWLWQTAAAGC